jgi:putative iron-dependent peroxidase
MTASGPPPVSQLVVQDLTRAAIFLVVTVNPATADRAAVRSFCSDLPALVRAVGFRDIEGTYVIVQKYLHDLAGWNAQSTETQERIIGRTKLSDIELDDAVKPPYAHNALAKVVVDGKEIKIIRDNMPFGRAAEKEFGTYFIGYARSPRTIEQMLENMFVGQPPGNYDRLLDFSVARTGNLFFVPSATFLENIADDDPVAGTPAAAAPEPALRRAGSLDIGSLKGDPAS